MKWDDSAYFCELLTWRPSWDCCEVSKSFDEGGNLNHHQKESKLRLKNRLLPWTALVLLFARLAVWDCWMVVMVLGAGFCVMVLAVWDCLEGFGWRKPVACVAIYIFCWKCVWVISMKVFVVTRAASADDFSLSHDVCNMISCCCC
jgi:hypothetical protein